MHRKLPREHDALLARSRRVQVIGPQPELARNLVADARKAADNHDAKILHRAGGGLLLIQRGQCEFACALARRCSRRRPRAPQAAA
jgi:hypothetical protein